MKTTENGHQRNEQDISIHLENLEDEAIRTLREPFNSEKFDKYYPNFRRTIEDGIFICHAGEDTSWIQEMLISPVVYERFPADGYFLHNAKSGGSKDYKWTVQAALNYCSTFLVVVTQQSIHHKWVKAEVTWAVEQLMPIIVCNADGSPASGIHETLKKSRCWGRIRSKWWIDFSVDGQGAQRELARILDGRVQKKRNDLGRPDV